MKSIAAASTLVLASTMALVRAQDGSSSSWNGNGTVTFVHGAHQTALPVSASQTCINIGACVGPKPNAVSWQGLPEAGVFREKAYIYFYVGEDCKGRRRGWSSAPLEAPMELEYNMFDTHIGSFMIWERSGVIEDYANGCVEQ